MALATVRDLIGSSLLLAGAINKGEDTDPDEYSDGLDVLNSMLGSWSVEQLMLPYIASQQFLTVPGQANYSIGPGGNWDGVRPTQVREAWYMQMNMTYPLAIYEFQQYGDIPDKSVTSTDPIGLMYNASYPLGFVALFPIPSTVIKVILAYDAFFAEVTLDSSIKTLPAGYIHAIRYGLASLLPAEYGKNVPAKIEQEAVRSKGVLKSSNLHAMDAKLDSNLPGMRAYGWDYRIG